MCQLILTISLLEWIRRKHNDDKTIAELFFVCCEDIQDMELTAALRSLMSIFTTGIQNGRISIDETVRIQLIEWFVSQPAFIQSVFPEFVKYIGADEAEYAVLAATYCQQCIFYAQNVVGGGLYALKPYGKVEI